jgi:F0F1-type ATP synthase assembly protein I
MAETGPDQPEDPLKSAARGRFEAMRTFGQVGTLGLSFVIALAIGVALGTWLDRVTGWGPWFFIVFFILGFGAGVLNVYRTISRMR